MKVRNRLLTGAAALLCAFSAAFAHEGAKPFTVGAWASIRDAASGEAKVVHLWGMTCAPCRTEMPLWGELRRSLPDAKLVFIHAERPPRRLSDIHDFLRMSGLEAAENWYFAERFVEPLRYEIEPDWRGELPVTILVGRDGRSKMIIGTTDLAEVRNWLDREQGKGGE